MATGPDPFLGTGWSFPPTFSKLSCSVSMVSDDRDIRESLWILLSTRKGERLMVPEYGCDIWQYVFRTITTTLITQIKNAVEKAILDWEPRVTVQNVDVSQKSGTENTLLVTTHYVIRQTNARSNLVFPFYLEEGTTPPLEP